MNVDISWLMNMLTPIGIADAYSGKYCHRCWHIVAYVDIIIVTHMNVDISWLMNMLTT